MTKEEISAYKDGAYDSFKQIVGYFKQPGIETVKDCIDQVELIIKNMEQISTRRLGLK